MRVQIIQWIFLIRYVTNLVNIMWQYLHVARFPVYKYDTS
jgi:hypothetical protein